ncbi:uncharacterized protein LOC121416946 [Lytechinus variegatus]|uniref:uncharacterized protein LOC121416946 n=1 Tax=Lytechinus variegatus TaxID=7654 RepID=UPI001BB2C4D3|nr:uncharacterized protein LOC121416946 [Lytechinus variegatus]
MLKMGSSASTRRLPPVQKIAEPPSAQNSDASREVGGHDEADSGPVAPEGIIEPSNPAAPADTLADISDVLLVDSAAAKAKLKQEFSEEIKQCLIPVKEGIQHIQECDNFPCDSCNEHMKGINKVSRNKSIDRNAAADGLAIDTDYCKMFSYRWSNGELLQQIEDADPTEELTLQKKTIFTFYIELLGSSWNFTDKSEYFCLQMEEDGCLALISDWFLHLIEGSNSRNKWVDDLVFDAMNVIDNSCMRVRALAPRHHRVVPAIQKFGESTESLTQTIAYMTLAKLVKKEEADKLSTNTKCIVSLLSLLKKCLSNPDHKASTRRQTSKKNIVTVISLDAEELVQSVEDLAINDNNKKLIVTKGGISLLAELLKPNCSTEEKISAANTIWRLAFLKENKEKLRKDQGIIYNLTEYSQSEHEKLRTACMGALFEIYESRLPENLKSKKTDDGSPQRAPSDTAKSTGHIMLSYKWEHPSKPVMREFKKELRKRGYTVWMDEDHMMGDKIGAMAEAVENADMIIACITSGYQDSQDCRTEASYAYECKKKIIPVKVKADFKASGWLGGITAGKIYYIVQKAELVSEVLPSIIEKEFAVQKETIQKVNATTTGSQLPEQEPKSPPTESQVPGWDSKRVQDWLAANNVTSRNKALKSINGTQLLQLKKQLTTVPHAFYQSMKDDLKVPYLDVLSLAAALENLE